MDGVVLLAKGILGIGLNLYIFVDIELWVSHLGLSEIGDAQE